MVSQRATNRIAGILLLGLVGVIVSTVALGIVDPSTGYWDESFQQLLENQGRFLINVGIQHVSSVLALLLAAALYLAFRPYDHALALLGAIGFLALGFTLIMANIGGAMLANITDEYQTASGARAAAIEPTARAAAMLYTDSWFDGFFTFLPLSLLAFGALIARSRALPRWLGWLAIASGLVIPSFWLILPPFEIDLFWGVGMLGMMDALLWLLLAGGWLLVRGTRQGAAAHT